MALPVPSARELFDGSESARELAMRKTTRDEKKSSEQLADEHARFVKALQRAAVSGYVGETRWGSNPDNAKGFVVSPSSGQAVQVSSVTKDPSRSAAVEKALADVEMAKSAAPSNEAWDNMAKEWTLTNPVPTGLVPFDLNFGVAA